MKISKIIKTKFKTLSLTLATLLTCSIVVPALPTYANAGGKIELGGLSAQQWNAMTEEQREEHFNNLKATGNTGAGVMVGGWTNGAGPLMVPPITMDGNTAYCMQALRDFPVGAYYANPSVSTNTQVRSVAYHGYPNNGSGLQQKHGLSNTQAQQYTQVAIWKVMGQIGPGLAIADRTHPYVDELVSLANRGDIGAYTNMEFNLSSSTLEAHRFDGYQETDAVGTSGTPGTFTFPSNGDIWSVDVNGNAKNTFNIGESFKIRSTSNFDGIKELTINVSIGNPTALVFSGTGGNQDILQYTWGDPVQKQRKINVKFTALGTINLHKTNDKGTNLEGVKFGLYSDKEATNLLVESTTDANGNIIFSDLKEGTYYVKELATLEGHILSNEVKEVTVAAGQTNAFEWVNETIKSIVKFFKYDEETKQPMPNVEFKIEALTGFDKGQVFNVKTDETGYFTKELSYGKYQITEVKTNEGYVLNTQPIPFEVNENGQTIELSMANKKIESKVKFLKVDAETGKPMPNVKFTIRAIDGFDKDKVWNVTTDETGYFTLDLKYGNYEIVEVETLEGYVLNTTPIKFTVNQDGQTIELSMKNDRVKGDVQLVKLDSETGKPMPNVEFKIKAITGFDKDKVWNLKSDKDGIIKANLEYGTYEIVEVKTLEGYVLNETPIKFEITKNGQIIELEMTNDRVVGNMELLKLDATTGKPLANVEFKVESLEGFNKGMTWTVKSGKNGIAKLDKLQYGKYRIVEVKTVEGYILDTTPIEFEIKTNGETVKLEMKNERITGNAELLKVDADTKEPLANVEFELECLDGFSKGEKITLISDENGLVKMNDLQYGKYKVTEIKTVEGYVLDSTPIEFEIKNNGETVKLEMVNKKIIGKLEIIKIDGTTNKKLQGAEFGIYDKDKNLIETIVTDENGSAISSELVYGEYFYRELKSPEGYETDGNFYEFNIEENNIVKVVRFKNFPTITYEKDIEPKKWDRRNGTELPYTGGTSSLVVGALGLALAGAGVKLTRKKK